MWPDLLGGAPSVDECAPPHPAESTTILAESTTDLAPTCGFTYTGPVACGTAVSRIGSRTHWGGPRKRKSPGRRVSDGDGPCASGRKSGGQKYQVKETNE